MESRMEYEEFKMRQSRSGKGQNCHQHTNLGRTMVTCSLLSENDIHKDLWTNQGKTVNEIKSKNVENLIQKFQTISNEDGENEEIGRKLADLEPSLPPKFDKWPEKSDKVANLDDPDWPTAVECTSQVVKHPQWNEFPTVFLSPENKGFK